MNNTLVTCSYLALANMAIRNVVITKTSRQSANFSRGLTDHHFWLARLVNTLQSFYYLYFLWLDFSWTKVGPWLDLKESWR